MSQSTPGGAGEAPSACPVALCPICTLVTLTGQARPDVVEHLLKAGQEIVLAVKAVIDARTGDGADPGRGLERIEVE